MQWKLETRWFSTPSQIQGTGISWQDVFWNAKDRLTAD